MSYETGAASTLADLFGKLKTFAVSVAGWTLMKYVSPNVVSAVPSVGVTAGSDTSTVIDPATMFGPDATFSPQMPYRVRLSGITTNAYITLTLGSAAEVDTLVLTSANALQMPTKFKLQYSDDGSSWGDAVDQTVALIWSSNETKTFTSTNTSPHLYWRLVFVESPAIFAPSAVIMKRSGSVSVSNSGELYLKGPGLAAADEIFVNFRSWRSGGAPDEYVIQVNGATGFDTNLGFFEQPNTLGAIHDLPLIAVWDQPMTYWFSANGRAIMGVVKVTTTYQNFYAGFMLPYCLPSQYPYPMVIAASHNSYSTLRPARYSRPDEANSGMTTVYKFNNSSNFYIYTPGGVWLSKDSDNLPVGYNTTLSVGPTLDGVYVAQPVVLQNSTITPTAIYGELDRIKWVSGEGQSSENTGTIGGTNHVIFQITNNTANNSYFAMEAM